MKVLFIHCAYKNAGGEDTVVSEEIKLLRANGIDVELVLFSNIQNSFWNLLQLPFNISAYRKVNKKIREFKPDVVHVHNLHFGASPSVLYSIRRNRIPFVMTLHNFRLLCPSATLFYGGSLFLSSLAQAFPWKAIKHGVYRNSKLLTFWIALSVQFHHWIGTWKMCSLYILFTDHARSIYLNSKMRFMKDRIVLKPNFCSPPDLHGPGEGEYFLYAGRLSQEKGVEMLLRVFSQCPYSLVIAGDGPLRNKVLEYSAMHPNIRFVGSKPKNEIFRLMEGATALLFPSIWFEGMPLIIIESFACGTPVISSMIGATRNMITNGHDGLHFEPGNEQDMLDKITLWQMMEPPERKYYRDNAQKCYQEYYSPEENIGQLLSIYESVIPRQSATVLTLV